VACELCDDTGWKTIDVDGVQRVTRCDCVRESSAAFIGRVIRQHLWPGAHRELVSAWETALSFDAWHRLARGHRLSRPAVRRTIIQWLNVTRSKT